MHIILPNKLLGKNAPLRKKIILEYMKSPSGVADRVLAETLRTDQSDLVKQHLKALKSSHLFSWDNVPGDDSEGLLKHLVEDYGIEWAENAEIHKSNDNKTAHISKDGNSAEITIEEEGSATLKIDNRAYDLQVEEENGELNLYKPGLIEKCSVAVTRPMGRVLTPTEIVMNGHCWSSDINTVLALVCSNALDYHDIEVQHALTNLLIDQGWVPMLIERYDDLLSPFVVINIPSMYLFSWDNVPGKDSERLIRYFNCDLDIDHVESVEIHKSDDGKIVHVRNGDKSAKIMIDKKKEKATIKINNEKTLDLEVKGENGKLNIYTFSTVENYPTYYEVVGRVKTGDGVLNVMEKYHIPKEQEGCIEKILTHLPSKEDVETKLKLKNYINRSRGLTDDLKYGDTSFVIIKPHLSKKEKIYLEKSLKTNCFALKFVSYFVSANCEERHQIITQIKSGANNHSISPSAARRMERILTLGWVAARTNIPPADYDRMYDELFDAFKRRVCINWIEFFNQLSYFNSVQVLSA